MSTIVNKSNKPFHFKTGFLNRSPNIKINQVGSYSSYHRWDNMHGDILTVCKYQIWKIEQTL